MPFVAPWLVPPNYLAAMQAGAGLGLQVRAQQNQEDQQRAAQALQQQSLIQQQAARQQQAQQQSASDALRFQEAQMHSQNALAQLQQQGMYHEDTLAEQARDNARQDAAAALAWKRQTFAEERDARMAERQAKNDEASLGFKERETKLAEDKFAAGSAKERQNKQRIDAAVEDYKTVFGEPDENAIKAINSSVLDNDYKQLSPKDSENIQVNLMLGQGAARVSNAIDNFNTKYGKDAFTKGYASKVPNWINDFEKGFVNAPPDEKDRAAWAIAQEFQAQYNPLALIRSGTAVTPLEGQRLDREIGTIKSGNFANEVKKFGELRAREAATRINNVKGRRSISRPVAETAEQLRQSYGLNDVPEIIPGYEMPLKPLTSTMPSQSPDAGGTRVGRFIIRTK